MSVLPLGFSMGGLHCGVKRNPQRPDLVLMVSDRPSVAAGVYTTNLVCAAPVVWDRQLTPSDAVRAVVINSGNANACTGDRGYQDASAMAAQAAGLVQASPKQALVLSTGIIGEFLPMQKITSGLQKLFPHLGTDEEHLQACARGFMTTDTVPKIARKTLHLSGQEIRLVGIAKGAAMIGPKMATMLCVILTDACLQPATAQQALFASVDDTFNCISVEGHMSTNDTVVLLANGAAGGKPLAGDALLEFSRALHEACQELAQAIVYDGEGTSHVIQIDVQGCRSREEAHTIAKTVAESALVKAAICGADPNWGRIVSAAGYAGVPFKPEEVNLVVNDFPLFERGAPLSFDAKAVSNSIRENKLTQVLLTFRSGTAGVRFWTTDLTEEYVRLNSEYHT